MRADADLLRQHKVGKAALRSRVSTKKTISVPCIVTSAR